MCPIKKLENIEKLWKLHSHVAFRVITVTRSPIFLFTSIIDVLVPHFWHMARGKALSDDLRDVLLHMAQSLDITTITGYTGCKRRTTERILSEISSSHMPLCEKVCKHCRLSK